MAVTRSMSGTSKKASVTESSDTKFAGNHKADRKSSRENSPPVDKHIKHLACDHFILTTFLPKFREENPDVDLSTLTKRGELGNAGSREYWVSMSDREKAPYMAVAAKNGFEKETAFYKAYKKTAAEIARKIKKRTAKRKRLTSKERYMHMEAYSLFLSRYLAEFLEKHPDVLYTQPTRFGVWRLARKEWATMTDSHKAPYIAEIEAELEKKKVCCCIVCSPRD